MFRSEDEPFFNLAYYANPDFDALIDSADAVSGIDIAKASDLFIQAQELLLEDAAAIFILTPLGGVCLP